MMGGKPGRNDACGCGSGRKYKRCCGLQPVAEPAMTPAPLPGELVALANARRYPEMEKAASHFVAAQPQSGFGWKALCVALQMQGKDALHAAQRAALLLPQDPDCHSNLGSALRRLGRLEEAAMRYTRALELAPKAPELWNNLGNVQRDLGRFDAAIATYRRALELRTDFAVSHNNLGVVLQSAGRLDEAMESYRRAVAIEPEYVDAHVNVGIALRLQSRTPEAQACCRRALELNPSSAAALRLQAELDSDRGEFAAAEETFKRAIAVEPDSAEAWAGIAGLRRMTREDTTWLAGAQRLAERSPVSAELYLRYALGKYFDDVGDYAEAFAHYRRANDLAGRRRPPHDRQLLTLGIDRVIDMQNKNWLDRAGMDACSSDRPVFIIGMPRSGTTLAEQILASHPEVFGAGELPFWNSAAALYALARDERDDEGGVLKGLAREYLSLLATLSPQARRVVDKMPANFLYLGLIHAVFPKAKIIHLCRHPIDTCLSIYFQNFGAAHPYANDLTDLAHYYNEYVRLMDHWRRTLPTDAILTVSYEALVDDAETWARRMVDFIALPWDPACLEFHRNGRTVNTFSKWQARQRISKASVDRWRRYESFIGPLRHLAS